MNNIIYLVPAFGVVGLLYTAWRFSWVSSQPVGDANMQKLSGYIADGAIAFLKAEWKILAYFAIPTAIILGYLGTQEGTPENPIHSSPLIAVAFLIGALLSATAGYIGMRVATKANVRTAQAARTSLAKALEVSYGRFRHGNGRSRFGRFGFRRSFHCLLQLLRCGQSPYF